MLELLLAAVLLVYVWWLYNSLVTDRNRVLAAWSDTEVQLKKRHDLVPQLVSSVKAYAQHERTTLEAVTALRTRSEATEGLADKAALEHSLEAGMQRLLLLAEAYPDLHADQNFRQLQTALVEIEDHLQYARRYYNGAVRMLNVRVQTFPHLLLARLLRFNGAEYFAVDSAAERQAPLVELQ